MNLLIIFLVLYIDIASAYVLNPVEGVNSHVEAINFDSDGNIYIATTNASTSRYLHKLSPSREVLWTIELPSYDAFTNEIYINSQKDIYLHFLGDFILAVLKSNSTTFEIIDERVGYLNFMDTDENIIYSKDPYCYVLRPNSTVPIQIKNIENFYSAFPSKPVIDNEGNIYFIGNLPDLKTAIIMITREALQEEVPYATVIRNASDPLKEDVEDFFVDKKNNFWLFIYSYDENYITVKKLSNNSVETIWNDIGHSNIKPLYANDRVYVASYDYWNGYNGYDPKILYITLENEVIDIPALQNLTLQKQYALRFLADKEGYAYFQTNSELTPELGSMAVIKPNETKPIPISFNSRDIVVERMFLDHNSDVWLFDNSGDMYFLKKEAGTGEKIPNFREICTFLNSNLVTKEVFFSCFSGLYVAVEND